MKTLSASIVTIALLAASQAHAQEGYVEEPRPAPAPAEPQPKPKPERQVPVGLRADGGYSLRTLEKLPLTGADLGLAIGAQPGRHMAIWGEARLFLGSTENGLSVKGGRFNFDLDLVFDRFRLTLEPGIFVVGIDRATRNQTIVGWGPKLGAAARFDLIQTDAFAFFARAGVDGGPTFSDGSLFGGVTFGGGIDFDIKRGDRSTL